MGGGTVLNGLVWTRGSRKDYDAWDDLNHVAGRTKKYGWRWNDMLPYFIKVGLWPKECRVCYGNLMDGTSY